MLTGVELDINETNICSPKSAAWSFCRCDKPSSPWSRCPRCWRKSCWRSRRRSGTGRTFSPRCCCRWSVAWTCSQSSGRSRPAGRNAGLPSPSGGLVRWERENTISIMKTHPNAGQSFTADTDTLFIGRLSSSLLSAIRISDDGLQPC